MKLCIFILLLILGLDVYSQERIMCGARSAGMGNATVAVPDFWSIFSNQAGLATLENISIGVGFENRFAVNEISTIGFGAAMPIRKVGTVALRFDRFGYSQFSNTSVGISISRQFFKSLSVGLQLDYINFHLGGNYGNRNLFTFEAGVQYQPHSKVIIGFHLFNPIRVKIDPTTGERMRGYYKLGVTYMPISKILTAIEVEQGTDNAPLNLKAGVEYRVIKELAFRVGIESANPSYAFGISTYFYNFDLDISANFHQRLGLTSQISIAYHFNK